MSKKDEAPSEIAAIRAQRERRRLWRGFLTWVAWLAVLIAGYVTGSGVLIWFSFALCMVNLAVINGLYEKFLRKITGRPPADYHRIRKLQKRELPAEGKK